MNKFYLPVDVRHIYNDILILQFGILQIHVPEYQEWPKVHRKV